MTLAKFFTVICYQLESTSSRLKLTSCINVIHVHCILLKQWMSQILKTSFEWFSIEVVCQLDIGIIKWFPFKLLPIDVCQKTLRQYYCDFFPIFPSFIHRHESAIRLKYTLEIHFILISSLLYIFCLTRGVKLLHIPYQYNKLQIFWNVL